MSEIASAAVFFPEKAAVYQTTFQKRKPTARIAFTLLDGSERCLNVPVRVGKIVNSDLESIPCTLDDALSYIEGIQGRTAYALLVDALSRRDHSRKEVEDKLRLQGFSPDSISFALEKAERSHFIDDDRFADYFILERCRRGWGRIKIEQELKRRGVDPSNLAGYPDKYFDAAGDFNRAMLILDRKSVPEAHAFEKLVRHLLTKGFPYEVAKDAVREHLSRS